VIVRRLLVAGVAIAVAGGGGATWAASGRGAAKAPAAKVAAAAAGPTAAQLAFRKTYLAAILAGDKGVIECGCTAAVRAKERHARFAAARRAAKHRAAALKP
jgi:hypothetical protein